MPITMSMAFSRYVVFDSTIDAGRISIAAVLRPASRVRPAARSGKAKAA